MAREKSQSVTTSYDFLENISVVGNMVWDTGSLSWVKAVQADVGGGGLPLTDAQLRATPVPISGTVTATGPVTDTQLRASAVPVSLASMPSTPVTGAFFQATQPVSAAALPLPSGASTETTVGTRLSESDFDSKAGSLTETAPATDTASSGLNGRLQRLAQRITSLIALLPAALVGGRLDVNIGAAPATITVSGTVTANGPLTDTQLRATPVPVSGTVTASGPVTDTQLRASAVPVSAVSLPLPANASQETGGNLATLVAKDFATSAKQDTGNTSLSTIAAKDFATSAKQDTGNASLTTLAAKDFATSAKQDTAQTSLSSIDTKLTTPVARGTVSDGLPDSTIDGTVQSLSLTKQGRLRVASTPEDFGVSFYDSESKEQWKEFEPQLNPASPWGSW